MMTFLPRLKVYFGGFMSRNDADCTPSAKLSTSAYTHRRTTILVVSDVRLVRDGIAQALHEAPGLLLLGVSGPDLADKVAMRLCPDVALLDIRDADALDIVPRLRAAHPPVKVVALGVAESEELLLACAQAGMSGFVGPNASVGETAAAVQSAMRNELVCTPRMAGVLLNRIGAMASSPGSRWGADELTTREQEIAALMSEGLSNKQIARTLGIQNATVKNHVHNVLGKLRINRRFQVRAPLRSVLNVAAFRRSREHLPRA